MSKAQELADLNEKTADAWRDGSEPHRFRLDTAAELRRLDRENAELLEALNSTNAALEKIGDYAHDRSTGPAVWDPLWEIRSMAYDNVFCVDAALSSSGGNES